MDISNGCLGHNIPTVLQNILALCGLHASEQPIQGEEILDSIKHEVRKSLLEIEDITILSNFKSHFQDFKFNVLCQDASFNCKVLYFTSHIGIINCMQGASDVEDIGKRAGFELYTQGNLWRHFTHHSDRNSEIDD